MASAPAKVVVADYDYGDVDIERAIIEEAGFELVAAQCKTEDEVIEVARDAAAVMTQYAAVTARVIDELHELPGDRALRHRRRHRRRRRRHPPRRPGHQRAQRLVRERGRRSRDGSVARGSAQDQRLRPGDPRGKWQWQSGAPIHRLRGTRLRAAVVRRDRQGDRRPRPRLRHARSWRTIRTSQPTRSRRAGARAVSFDELVTRLGLPGHPGSADTGDAPPLRRGPAATMKPTAILVNTARGPIVDDHALHRALERGLDRRRRPRRHRGGAGQGQRLATENPLLRLDNVVITPHAAYYSEESSRHGETVRRRRGGPGPHRGAAAVAGQRCRAAERGRRQSPLSRGPARCRYCSCPGRPQRRRGVRRAMPTPTRACGQRCARRRARAATASSRRASRYGAGGPHTAGHRRLTERRRPRCGHACSGFEHHPADH